MNEAFSFDTSRLITHLTANGFAMQQAEVLANEIKDLLKNLATKSDLADMVPKSDLADMVTKSDLANLATTADLKAALAIALADMVTKSDFQYALDKLATKADLRADIAEAKYDIIKWMAGLLAGAVIATVSLLKFF